MFNKILIASGFAALAAAQSTVLGFDHVPNPITDGQAQAITFHTNDTITPVSITLKKGISTDLQNVQVLTTSAHDGQYIWTPSKSLANGNDYALYIQQGSAQNYNYYGPFQIQGADPSAVASASSSSAHSAAGYGSSSSSSVLSSTTVSANGTASTTVPLVTTTVGTVGSAAGTGTALPRNTTMSIATLTTPMGPSSTEASQTASSAGTSGAGFQSATSSAAASSPSNAASGVEISGALSMVFGVAAAVFYLQ